jgi:amidase
MLTPRTEADVSRTGDEFSASIHLPASEMNEPHSEWVPPYGPMIVVLARDTAGAEAGLVVELA